MRARKLLRQSLHLAGLTALLAGCKGQDTASAAPAPELPREAGVEAKRCIVHLHGKGGQGASPRMDGERAVLSPSGNAEGWGGRQWIYFPDAEYQVAKARVTEVVDSAGCEKVLLAGFSNGAAFAAKLYCQGEDLGGRLAGVVVDDPVPDEGTAGCRAPEGVPLTLYWTGALAGQAQPGWDCSEGDWTCEGGRTVGIEVYAERLGVPVTQSPNSGHERYADAPEIRDF